MFGTWGCKVTLCIEVWLHPVSAEWLKVNPRNPYDGERDLTPTSCSLASALVLLWWNVSLPPPQKYNTL